MISIHAVKNFPKLVTTVAIKNMKMKYKNSALGFVWSLLHPLAYLIIFTIVFSNAFPDIERYSLFALIGLMFWTFFNNTINQMMLSIIHNASVLKTIAVPKLLFPFSALAAELFTFLLSFIPFFGLMIFFGLNFSSELLLLIPAVLIFSIFSFGAGLLLCTLNVFFRDIGLLWNTLSPAIFYFTPIAYSAKMIPEKYSMIITLNPLYHYIEFMRIILYNNAVPEMRLWLITGGLAAGASLVGLLVYHKLKKSFVSFY
jgi:ABC-type polysaccharide/polyol phosphate export permease